MTTKINRFVPLRNYTQYSLSKGALRINELIDFCKKENVLQFGKRGKGKRS